MNCSWTLDSSVPTTRVEPLVDFDVHKSRIRDDRDFADSRIRASVGGVPGESGWATHDDTTDCRGDPGPSGLFVESLAGFGQGGACGRAARLAGWLRVVPATG